jgi:two-component system, OmpR family, sensor kinase
MRLRWRLAGLTVALLAAALASVGTIQYALLRAYLLERTYQAVTEQAAIGAKLRATDPIAVSVPGSGTAIVDSDGTLVPGQDAPQPFKPGTARPPWVDPQPGEIRSMIDRFQRTGGKPRAPTEPILTTPSAGLRAVGLPMPAVRQLVEWLTFPPWATLQTPEGDVMVAVYPLPDGRYLLIETPLSEVDPLLEADMAIFSVTSTAALGAVAALAVWLTARALSPLERVVAVAREVSRGEYDRRTGLRGAGEVASLSSAFDEMVDRLQERIRLERESEARMRRFLADASHELRTPVTGILGHLEVLRRGAMDSRADLEESLAAMHLASERMARLVTDLLTLARFEETEARLRAEPVDAAELVRDAARAARPATHDHAVALDPPADGLTVLGDRDAAERILVNLLDNAAKYSPAGTPIAVRVRPAGDRVELLVADRGPGVPPDERGRIFERLYRGDRSRANGANQGAGLGLAICRALARGQGGDVTVRDTPGGGATFVVTLPRAP